MMTPRPPAIIINDVTLRDCGRDLGAGIAEKDAVRVALALEAAGVDEIAAGTPALGGADAAQAAAITEALTRARPVGYCRMSHREVDGAARAGLEAVLLAAPVSGRSLCDQAFAGRSLLLGIVRTVVAHACDLGLAVAVAGEDAGVADLDFVLDVLEVAESAGATRFRFADTSGALDPLTTYAIFRQLCAATDLELEFEGSDGLGLAAANTLAAVQGGATHVCASVFGTKAAALDSFVGPLERLAGYRTNVDVARLPELTQSVTSVVCGLTSAMVGRSRFSGAGRGIVPGRRTGSVLTRLDDAARFVAAE